MADNKSEYTKPYNPAISQTRLFRDIIAFEYLKYHILPQLSEKKKIRIACIGCSTGEEPYSVLLDNWTYPIEIEAYDFNPENLESAKKGELYFRDELHHNISGYISKLDIPEAKDIYTIINEENSDYAKRIIFSEKAKKRIRFSHHDILENSIAEKYDIILLMNVLLHYGNDDKSNILKNVQSSMDNDTWLICETGEFLSPDWQREKYEIWMRNNMEKKGFKKYTANFEPIYEFIKPKIYKKHNPQKT